MSTSLNPGDWWTVQITNAAPSSAVIAALTKDGISQQIPAGFTDANGNFTYTGNVDSSAYKWEMEWYVPPNNYVGNVTFYVTGVSAPVTSGSGYPVPSPTVQPGVIPVPPAPVATITPNPSVPVAPAPSAPVTAPPQVYNTPVSYGGVYLMQNPGI